MIKKALSIAIVSISIVANTATPVNANELAPTIGKFCPCQTPVVSQTEFSEFSFESIEKKISDIFKLAKKGKPELAATYSGMCGDNVNWNLDTSSGKLTVSGTGAMDDYSNSDGAPWYSYRSSIKSIDIGTGITHVGKHAFYYYSHLTSVLIGSKVKTIADKAFYLCDGCTTLTIPNSVTSIGNQAFDNWSNLVSVNIGSGVTSIGFQAFSYCGALTSISVDSNNTNFKSIDGMLFNKSGTELIQCPGGKVTCTISSSVSSITGWAFYGCASLNSINVDSKNSNYKSINGVLFNKSGTNLIRCPNTKSGSYTIPDSATAIKDRAFDACTKITSITIPSSINSIGTKAFWTMQSLTDVIYLGTTDPGSKDVFVNCYKLTYVKVPSNYESQTFCGFAVSKSLSAIATRSQSPSRSPSRSRSPMATPSKSPSRSPMATHSRNPMATPSKSPTASPSNKFTAPVDYFRQKSNTIFVSQMLYHAFVLE